MSRDRTVSSLALLLFCGQALAGPDKDGVYVLTRPARTMEQVDGIYAGMPPVRYAPPADRWEGLPKTAAILEGGAGELRVVMLGDSIVNDTSRSGWDGVLERSYPKCRITKITCVRGSTGCWWFKRPDRVKRYILAHRPDLLVIGGISHRGDTDSVRELVREVRKGSSCDVLLMTGAFGAVDPRDEGRWRFEIEPEGKGYRARLGRLAAELGAGFLDMTALWGRYVRESGRELGWFKRDAIHANGRGEQILGRILAAHLAPPVGVKGESKASERHRQRTQWPGPVAGD